MKQNSVNQRSFQNLPTNVVAYLQRILIENHRPAYLVTDRAGRLIEKGGHLEAYGLQNLESEKILASQLDFLQGMLPLESPEILLPYVQVIPKTFADIHILRDGDSDFTVLIDVTSAEVQQGLLQQKANDLRLLQTEHTRFLELLRDLDMVLLEKVAEGAFQLIGRAPGWIEHCGLQFQSQGNLWRLANPLEFLSVFLETAEEFWRENEGRYKSPPWVETDQQGNEWYFEVTAMRNKSSTILVVERVAPYWDAQFALLQKGREKSLDYLRLLRAEKALREKETRHRILLQAVPDWIFRMNREGKILDLKATRGKNPSIFAEFLGQPLSEVFPEEAAAKMMECAARALAQRELETCTFVLGPPESSFDFEARVVAVGPNEVVLIVRDLPNA